LAVTGLLVAFAIAQVGACGGSSQADLFAGAGGGSSPDGTNGGSGTGSGTGDDSTGTGTGTGGTGGDAGATSGDAGGAKHDASVGDAGGADGNVTDATTNGDPGIFCGTSDVTGDDVYCTVPGQYCCATGAVGSTVFECKSNAVSACAGLRLPCDDRADCSGTGQVCCGVFDQSQGYTQVSCRSSQNCVGSAGGGQQYVRFCDPSAATDECQILGATCQPSQSLDGFYVCKS
jgi:hypothetical protein